MPAFARRKAKPVEEVTELQPTRSIPKAETPPQTPPPLPKPQIIHNIEPEIKQIIKPEIKQIIEPPIQEPIKIKKIEIGNKRELPDGRPRPGEDGRPSSAGENGRPRPGENSKMEPTSVEIESISSRQIHRGWGSRGAASLDENTRETIQRNQGEIHDLDRTNQRNQTTRRQLEDQEPGDEIDIPIKIGTLFKI